MQVNYQVEIVAYAISILQLHLQVKSSTAFSKTHPLENVDQSGNLLKHHDRQSFCFIHKDYMLYYNITYLLFCFIIWIIWERIIYICIYDSFSRHTAVLRQVSSKSGLKMTWFDSYYLNYLAKRIKWIFKNHWPLSRCFFHHKCWLLFHGFKYPSLGIDKINFKLIQEHIHMILIVMLHIYVISITKIKRYEYCIVDCVVSG